MDGDAQAVHELPALPEHLSQCVVIDTVGLKFYCEPRRRTDPHVVTWIDRCRQRGYRFEVITAELDEIPTLRVQWQNGAGQGDRRDDAALENREAAMRILANGADYRASDIHILLRGKVAEIQFRVKGELRVAERVTHQEGEAIARAFYQGIAVVKDATFKPLEVQNAQISGEVIEPLGLSSVRVVRGPAYPVEAGGGFMVLRLQYTNTIAQQRDRRAPPVLHYPRRPEGSLRLAEMGYSAAQEEKLRYLTEGSNGIVLFTGPTGSGKTTTIFELLRESARVSPMLRLVSIENPVEYPMPWAVQLSISGDGGREGGEGDAFGDCLRASLRMDPDWVFLGEIRSAGVALTAFEASLTGHKVVSTIHSEDPFSVPLRIEIMDSARLPRRMFCSAKLIRGIVNQRLVPQLCPDCSLPLDQHVIGPRLLRALETFGDLSMVRTRGPGCEACNHDGFRGRTAVAEVIITDASLMTDFIEHGADEARRRYRQRSDADGSVLKRAMAGVLLGQIDPRDVGRYVDVITAATRVDE